MIDQQLASHGVGVRSLVDDFANGFDEVGLIATGLDELDHVLVHLCFQVLQFVLLGRGVDLSVWEHGLTVVPVSFVCFVGEAIEEAEHGEHRSWLIVLEFDLLQPGLLVNLSAISMLVIHKTIMHSHIEASDDELGEILRSAAKHDTMSMNFRIIA